MAEEKATMTPEQIAEYMANVSEQLRLMKEARRKAKPVPLADMFPSLRTWQEKTGDEK